MTMTRERATTISASAPTATAGYAQFGRAGGRRDDRCPQLTRGEIASLNGATPHRDYLYIICEPVEMTPRAAPVGANVMAAIRDIYAESNRDDPVTAIAAAVDAANEVLYTKNRAGAPGLRVVLGLTCLIVRDRDLIICQVPPTQAVVVQNGTPIFLPELASWRGDYQPREGEGPHGLGMHETVTPLFFRATLEPDDLLVLCSSNLAATLAAGGADAAPPPFAGDDPEAIRDHLARLAEERHLDAAYAAAIAPPLSVGAARATGRAALEDGEARPCGAEEEDDVDGDRPAGAVRERWLGSGLRGLRERAGMVRWPRRAAGPSSRIVPKRADYDLAIDDEDDWREDPARDAWGDDAGSAYALEDVVGEHPSRAPSGRAARGAVMANDETDALDDARQERVPRRSRRRSNPAQVLWSALAVVVLVAGALLERARPVSRRHRQADELERGRGRVLPLGSLERWDNRFRLGRWAPLLVVGALAILAALLIGSVRYQRARAAEAQFDVALSRVAGAREAATAAPDRPAAYARLLVLRADLDAIATDDRPGWQERVAAEGAALATALDRVAGVERVGAAQVQLLATSPVPPDTVTSRPQLVVGGGQQFALFNGTVYQVDGRGNRALVKILAKGDSVGGVSAGQLLGIAWRIDSLLAFDERYGYVRDAAGAWSAQPLAATGQKPVAADSFGGNLYLLAADRGQIVKYTAGAYAMAPQPWSSAKANGELALAVDLTIDKDIYVLLSDGRVLDFFQGELKGTSAPALVPPLSGATAIYAAPEGNYLYLVDPREGRIVRLARDGSVAGNYKAAEGASSFAGAREIAVDESAGVAYILTNEGLLAVQLPPAKR